MKTVTPMKRLLDENKAARQKHPVTYILHCYKCTNVKLKNSNPVLAQLLSGQTDEWCEHPSISDATETCPSSTDYMCGFFEGSVSFSLPFVGGSKVTIQKRGCLKVESNKGINQCHQIGSDAERKFVGVVLSVLSEVSEVNVDGKICVCGTDLCDANCNGVAIGPVCLSIPVAVVLGIVGSIFSLLLVTCCCCCCCCACCKSRRPHIVTVGMPRVTVMTLPETAGSAPPYSRLQDEEMPAK